MSFLFQLAVGQSHFAVVTVEKELFTWAVSAKHLFSSTPSVSPTLSLFHLHVLLSLSVSFHLLFLLSLNLNLLLIPHWLQFLLLLFCLHCRILLGSIFEDGVGRRAGWVVGTLGGVGGW